MYQILEQSSDSNDLNNNYSTIENILIPYCGKIPQQLSIGSVIKILGKIDGNAKRFAINLMTDCEDIAFHFNPRLNDGFVVRNSRIDNIWCNEEREPLFMPFEENENFSLILSVEEECYGIFVNAIHFCDFRHRLPYSSLTYIAIDGELRVHAIQCEQNDLAFKLDSLSGLVPSFATTEQTPHVVQNIFDPEVPFVYPIDNGLRVGMVLTVIGRPFSSAHKFDINLVQNHKFDNNSDIALHISVRFGKTNNESTVVRNYRFGGEWGSEDKYCTEFPFIVDKIFDLRIIVESNRFILIINGKSFTEFPNRLYPLSNTNQIEIYGNLTLLSVRF